MKIVKYFIGLCLTVLFICNGSINVHASEPVTDINRSEERRVGKECDR